MADKSRLAALTPLGHAEPRTEVIGPFTITERVDTALASLALRHGREAEVRRAAKAAGIPLPEPGRYASAKMSAFWLAPDMWMIEAPFSRHEDIRGHLLQVFDTAASITEQTDAWVRFDLSGATLTSLMERLCNVDLARITEGAATRTVIDHLGCYIIKHSTTRITIYGPRSSAQTLHHALSVTAKSVA